MDLIKAVTDICAPICSDPDAIDVRITPSATDETIIVVTAEKEDVAKLIGRGGVVATSVRQLVSMKLRGTKKDVRVKFESF